MSIWIYPNFSTIDNMKSNWKLYLTCVYFLINLCDSSCIPIKYLVASSIARFKIGQYEDGYEIYDLMISLKKDKSLDKLMSEIKHYLQLINK